MRSQKLSHWLYLLQEVERPARQHGATQLIMNYEFIIMNFKTSLPCSAKKPCLHYKEGFFWLRTRLVCRRGVYGCVKCRVMHCLPDDCLYCSRSPCLSLYGHKKALLRSCVRGRALLLSLAGVLAVGSDVISLQSGVWSSLPSSLP